MENSEAIVEIVTTLLAKQMATEAAVQSLIASAPSPARPAIAEQLRQRAAEAMQENAQRFSPAMDAQFSLSLAAFLEAAGEPPNVE